MPGRLEPETLPRRDFLGLAGLWSAAIAITGSLLGMARMTKPRVLPEASARVRIGKADELPPGTTRIMNEHNIRVTSTREGIAATSLICTHLGCVVKESPDGFACPCHGSKFDVTGKVVSGPAPRALPWLSVSQAADGTLIVDRKVEVPSGTYYEIA